MSSAPDLDPYASASSGESPITTWLRRVARDVGVLVGLAISACGAALYALRCFDTCPADPAEDKISQLLTVSIVLLGLIVVIGSAWAGTRCSVGASWAVTLLAATIGLAGAGTLALVPSLQTPGDHSSPAWFGVLALGTGVGVAAGSSAVRKRAIQRRPSGEPADAGG